MQQQPPGDYTFEEVEELLGELLDRKLAYQAPFAKLGGGAAPGVFLSQLYYWTRHSKIVIGGRDRWVFKTGQQWWDEAGLNTKELRQARKAWIERGVVEETRSGDHGKMHYRINRRRLIDLLVGKVTYEPEVKDGIARRRENLKLTRRRRKTGENVENRQTPPVENRQTPSVENRQTPSSENRQTYIESTLETTSKSTSKKNLISAARAARVEEFADPKAATAPSSSSSERILIPEPFPVDESMRAWAAKECHLVNVEDLTEKFVIEYSPEGKAGDQAPRFSMKLWLHKWRTWMRREQRFEERDRSSGKLKDPALDGDRPRPQNGGAATVNFAVAAAEKEKYATCPDCGGAGMYYPGGFDKGVARCKHKRWVPPAADEVGRDGASGSPPAR